MGRDVSIAVSVKDNASAPLLKAGKSMEELAKKADAAAGKIDELNKRKASIHVDMVKAKQELKAAEKALDGTKEAADRLEKARYDFESIQTELRSVSSEAKQAEKDLSSLNDAMQRSQNRAGGTGSGGSDILSRLAAAGATQMVGQVAEQAAQYAMQSAFGSEAGTMFSGILSGVTSGAAIGTAISPGIGTAIGAAAGGLLGAASGALNVQASREEALQSAVQELTDSSWEAVTGSLESGSGVAANREQANLAFGTLLGDPEEANEFLDKLQDFAEKTPFGFTDLTSMSKTLMSYNFGLDEMIPLMTAIGDAGSALGISGSDLTTVATMLGRMNSSGKTSLEYLNPLIERGIPVMDYLSEALGKSKEAVYDMVSRGLIPGEEAARVIAEAMGTDFANSMEKQAQTYSGLSSTLEDAQEQLDAVMGEGYNETRKQGLQDQIDWLGSGATKDAYRLIGEYQAELENEKERILRKKMDEAVKTPEYRKALAEDNGAEMGRILAEAQADAESEYRLSEGYQDQLESQKLLVSNVREALIEDGTWRTFGYDMGQEFSKGFLDYTSEVDYGPYNSVQTSRESRRTGAEVSRMMNGSWGSGSFQRSGLYTGFGHAAGISYVPYNDYPARLHEGERVLTASENRSYGAGANVSVVVNGLTVREEADVDRVAEVLARKISEARELAAW